MQSGQSEPVVLINSLPHSAQFAIPISNTLSLSQLLISFYYTSKCDF